MDGNKYTIRQSIPANVPDDYMRRAIEMVFNRAILESTRKLWDNGIYTIELKSETKKRDDGFGEPLYMPGLEYNEVTASVRITKVETHRMVMWELPECDLRPYVMLRDKKPHCIYCGAEYIVDGYGCCHSCGGPQGMK